MDVTPQELRGSEIKDSWRGYDRDEVDDLLERAAVTIEGLAQRLQESASRPAPAAAAAAPAAPVPLPSSRDDADMLQRTLLLAQRAADDAVNEAQSRARQIVDESEAKAQTLVSDAEATARRIAEGERRRLEAEIEDLSSRRELLRADADALDSYASAYRDRLRAAIEADLAHLGRDVDPPSPRPELHEVDVAPAREPQAAEPDPPSFPVIEDEQAWDPGPTTRPVGAVTGTEAGPGGTNGPGGGAPSPVARAAAAAPVSAPPRPVTEAPRPATDWPPPAPVAAAPAPADAESSWLDGADEWAASEGGWETPAPWERDSYAAAAPDPLSTALSAEIPLEANPIDTDSLDDDAFFASLREAVRDEAPLGPRDEEQNGFFDNEQDRRRFRRRR
jgi:DivIVA domain-containing protein